MKLAAVCIFLASCLCSVALGFAWRAVFSPDMANGVTVLTGMAIGGLGMIAALYVWDAD